MLYITWKQTSILKVFPTTYKNNQQSRFLILVQHTSFHLLIPSTFSNLMIFQYRSFIPTKLICVKSPITKDFCLPTFESIYLPNTIQNSPDPVPFSISFKFSPRRPYIIDFNVIMFSSSSSLFCFSSMLGIKLGPQEC